MWVTHGNVEDMKEMIKTNNEAAWGKCFGILHVGIPLEMLENPIDILCSVK